MTITPDLLKMVAYCLAPLDEERARVLREFEGPEDWDLFCRFCQERGVLNLVYAMLKRAGREDIIPPQFRERMSLFYMNLAIHNELKLKSTVPLSAHLKKNGVDVLFFKGSSMLLAGDYGDFGERISSDVDVIIDERHRLEANRILGELEQWSSVNPDEMRTLVESKWLNKWGVLIEVHSGLPDLNGVPAATTMNRLWNHAREVSYNRATALIPSREDRFMQSAIHFAAHHSFELAFMLVCIADLAHIAGNEGKAMDWEKIYYNLQKERMLEHVMVVMEAADELIDYGPIKQGLEDLNSRALELQKITRPLARSLVKTIRGTRLFKGRTAMCVFSREMPLSKRARLFIPPSFKRSIKQFISGGRSFSEMMELRSLDLRERARLGNIWLNPKGWGLLLELRRFYRRTDYYGHCARPRPCEDEPE